MLKSVGNAQGLEMPQESFNQPEIVSTRMITSRPSNQKKLSQQQLESPYDTDEKLRSKDQNCEFIPISPRARDSLKKHSSEANSSWRHSGPSERFLEPKGQK